MTHESVTERLELSANVALEDDGVSDEVIDWLVANRLVKTSDIAPLMLYTFLIFLIGLLVGGVWQKSIDDTVRQEERKIWLGN